MAKRLPLPPEVLSGETADLYEAVNGQSALAAVLIGASALEQAVGSLLGRFFIEGSTSERLLDHKGPLGMLFNRASLAYALGLITKTIFNNLQAIGEIRNIFAHSHLHVDFTNKDVLAECKKLKTPFDSTTDADGNPTPWAQLANSNAETRFTFALVMTFSTVLLAAHGTTRRPACSGW